MLSSFSMCVSSFVLRFFFFLTAFLVFCYGGKEGVLPSDLHTVKCTCILNYWEFKIIFVRSISMKCAIYLSLV